MVRESRQQSFDRSANLRKLKDKVVAAYLEAGFQPPDPASFANQAGGNAANLNDLFEVCVAESFLVRIDGDIYLHAEDQWAEQSFLAEATTSQLRAFLARYTLLESMRPNAANLRHFRVLTQNFFIEVLTGREPVVSVRDDA